VKQLAEHLQMAIEVKEVLPAYQTDQNPINKQFGESLQMTYPSDRLDRLMGIFSTEKSV